MRPGDGEENCQSSYGLGSSNFLAIGDLMLCHTRNVKEFFSIFMRDSGNFSSGRC
jgi:hypothetical protein